MDRRLSLSAGNWLAGVLSSFELTTRHYSCKGRRYILIIVSTQDPAEYRFYYVDAVVILW